MNEEQRKASSVDVLAERDKKAEKIIVNILNMFISRLI